MKPFLPTLAIALAFSFTTSTPAEARLTEDEKCVSTVHKIVGKLGNCFAKADALVAAGKLAETQARDLKCVAKFEKTWGSNREKRLANGADWPCRNATDPNKKSAALIATLFAWDRDPTTVAAQAVVSVADLSASSLIQQELNNAVAAVTPNGGEQVVCAAAQGTWKNGACVETQNCWLCGVCGEDGRAGPAGPQPPYDGVTKESCDCTSGDRLAEYDSGSAFYFNSNTQALGGGRPPCNSNITSCDLGNVCAQQGGVVSAFTMLCSNWGGRRP